MARFRSRRRRYGRRRRGRRLGRRSTYRIAKRAAYSAIAKSTELKYVDFLLNENVPDAFGSLQFLTQIVQGTNRVNRIGNQILVKKITFVMNFNMVDTYQHMKVWIGTIRQEGVPIQSTWFPANTYGPINTAFFKIWKELNIMGVASTSSQLKRRVFHIRFRRGWRINYGSSTGDPNRDLYFVTRSDSIATSHPTIQGYVRVYFTDS